jgi:hypothetical protein
MTMDDETEAHPEMVDEGQFEHMSLLYYQPPCPNNTGKLGLDRCERKEKIGPGV